jgi:uncharacterized protein YodC (DUF2158 family)
MFLRPGNLVRHKSGGPIMMIDDRESIGGWRGPDDPQHQCTWVENGTKKAATFRASQLQSVCADGTPRNYDNEK